MAIKFQTQVPQTLTFPWGDFLPVQGQYGEQFLYTVEAAGQRDKLYAPPGLHRQLQEAGVGPGQVLTLTRVEGEGRRTEWVVEAEEVVSEAAPEPVAEPVGTAGPSAAGKRNGNGQAPAVENRNGNGTAGPGKRNGHPAAPLAAPAGRGPSEGVSFASLEQVMRRSLQAAWAAWGALEEGPAFSGEDVRAVAITLFLECARKNIVLPPAPEPGEDELPF